MANSNITNELNSKLKAKTKNDPSEAEKISVAESNADGAKCEASGESQKAKKKGGIFSKFKNAVKRPLRKKHSSDLQENGKSTLRTKSTSDLADAQEEESNATQEHGSKTKHGIAGFFGRQFKIRSSRKDKMKKSKKNESSSEPVSPDRDQRFERSPIREIDSKEREELATINKTLADDSFFQVSLTTDTPDTTILSDIAVPLSDFDSLEANTSGLSQQSVAQDRIRLAPKGRRKPTRFNSKSDTSDANEGKKPMPEKSKKVAAEVNSKVSEAIAEENATQAGQDMVVDDKKVQSSVPNKPSTTDKPKIAAEKPKIAAKKPMLPPAGKDLPKLDLSDVVVIHTPTEEKQKNPQSDSDKLTTPVKEDFGSWEHITSTKALKNSPDKESPVEANKKPNTIEENSEKGNGIKDSKSGIKELITGADVPKMTESDAKDTDKDKKKESVVKKSKGQDILDLIEGKSEKPPASDDDLKTEGKVLMNGPDLSAKSGSASSSYDKNDAPFGALVSRTRRFSDEQPAKSNDNKREVKFSAEKNNIENTSKNNWSFELDDGDDMRSNDLHPVQFQRSKSMSAVQKPAQNQLCKSVSIDSSLKYVEDKKEEKAEMTPKKNNLPDWIAIAKAKQQRNSSEDEEALDQTLEETMEEIQEMATQISLKDRDKSSPNVKEKPLSKIPKPAFKSQSLKYASPSQAPPATNLKPRNTISPKVSSPTSTCLVCTKPAYQFERCDVDGQVIHKNCAKCSMCSRTINVGTIRVINDKLYCGIHARTAAS